MDTDRVTVWTVHPSEFDLARPGLEYDHTQAYFWNCGVRDVRERYRQVLPILHRHFGVSQILWCWSSLVGWYVRDWTKEVAWELDVAASAVLDHFDTYFWDAVIRNGAQLDLSRLSLARNQPLPERWETLVRWPPGRDPRFRKLRPFRRNGPVDEYELQRMGATGYETWLRG